jgi:hypothetical protein
MQSYENRSLTAFLSAFTNSGLNGGDKLLDRNSATFYRLFSESL